MLPETVQNKIAAGEVIERPASVVKELAENAVDAGATMVAVELEEGGHRLIRVSDDGNGMDEEDLVACMQRHATSKINDVDDIFRISTFGFRGEALPSIGSVSRMNITSCPAGGAEGRELVVEAGKLVRVSPAAPRKGTRVEVRDIFFNTPARRKFLRQPASEGTRASEILTRLALGNPGCGFRLQTNGRITLAVNPAATLLDRIGDLFGQDMAARLVPFSNDIADGLPIDGYFARPPFSRRNSTDIYILVNRRWIRYYGLAKAMADAFQGILPPREYPFAIVNLTVDPARVDVNVHPTKEEVRFEQQNILVGGVKRAIREALEKVATLPTIATVTPGRGTPPAARDAAARETSPAFVPSNGTQKKLDMPGNFARRGTSDFSGLDLDAIRERIRGDERREPSGAQPLSDASVPQPSTVESTPSTTPTPPSRSETAATPGELSVDTIRPGGHRILGQAGGKYILVDGPDGILLVDPHALHERWNYDRLVEERKRGVASARLLLPLDFHLSPAEAASAQEAVPSLAEYGFEFQLPEPNRMVVTAAPTYIPRSKLEVLIRQILADVGDAGEAMEAAREKLLASLACRSSVLLGKSLPDEEILSLLDRFFNQGQMPTCPHGRPTAIRIGWDELARRFGR